MGSMVHEHSDAAIEARPLLPGPRRRRRGTTHLRHRPINGPSGPPGRGRGNRSHFCRAPPRQAPSHPWRRGLLWAGAVAGLAFGGYALAPTVKTMLETVSTDDAYVNGHVTYVAPRVAGQVSQVLVDDNDRVSKGDLLVQLDREPYQVQVDLKKAAVVNAEVDVEAAGPRSGASWPRPGASMEAPEGDRGRRRHGGEAQGPGRGPAGQGGDPRPRRGRPRPSQATLRPGRIPREEFDQRRRPSRRPRPRSSRPSNRSMRRGSPSASTRTRRGGPHGRPADLNQTFSGVSEALDGCSRA